MNSSTTKATLRKLGYGSFGEVYLASRGNRDKQVALKVIHRLRQPAGAYQEWWVHNSIGSHQNIVKLGNFYENYSWENGDGTVSLVDMIGLGYCPAGDLFDYALQGHFREDVCRNLAKQILDGLFHVHKSGFAHRDLKLENLLLDQDFVVKLSDFGHTDIHQGHEGDGKMTGLVGTQGYMAPEVLLGIPYNGKDVDLFAFAVTLFTLISGHPPFEQASLEDENYQLIADEEFEDFWTLREGGKPLGFFSEDFKNLINCMLRFNPDERLSMADVWGHPWFKGPCACTEEVVYELSMRQYQIEADRIACKSADMVLDD